VPAELPLFAEALGPEEWLAYNQIPIPDGKVDQQALYLAFTRQLGPRWQGVKSLPPYKQILLAAFCLKAARKRTDGDSMLGRVAECWDHEKGLQLNRDKKLLSDARRVLANKDICGKTMQKVNMHAFQTTAMLRALQTAREEGGVLAPAQFVWLRGFDRTLWYPLNNLGRQGFHMEAIGAMAHFKAEKLTNRPIPRPKLGDAMGSITEYIGSRRARPIPQLDYSGSKKRGIKKPKNSGVKKPKKKAA
jgi:intracellular multiplication protein IcmP